MYIESVCNFYDFCKVLLLKSLWSADEFHFAYKELSGAGVIIAKVESVENTDPWAKAGVMIRDTLESDSANVALLVSDELDVRVHRSIEELHCLHPYKRPPRPVSRCPRRPLRKV